MTDHTAAVLNLIEASFPNDLGYRITAYDGEALEQTAFGSGEYRPITPENPHVLVYGGQQEVANRRYHGGSRNRRAIWRALVASSTSSGARAMLAALTAGVDNTLLADSRLTCHFPSEPIWDREDPSDWKWSATVEIHHHT